MSTLKAAWRCMAKERPFPWQSGLARGLRRDNVPWHFQLWMLPFFPARHLSGSKARVLCNSVFQSPPYPHPLFWPKPCSDSRLTSANVALVDLRGLQLSFHCALVALLLTRAFFFFWAYPTMCWDRVDFQGKEVTITDRLVKSDTHLHILNSSHRWLHPCSLSSKKKSEALVHGGDNNSFIQWLLAGSLPAELHTA